MTSSDLPDDLISRLSLSITSLSHLDSTLDAVFFVLVNLGAILCVLEPLREVIQSELEAGCDEAEVMASSTYGVTLFRLCLKSCLPWN
jgi:hypothetical protein